MDEAASANAVPAISRHAAEGGSNSSAVAAPAVSSVIASGGAPLDEPTRTLMESRFGHDFGDVRIHTDGAAAASARDISAQAYTAGNHIAFGAGRYAPHTLEGQHLLAHELTHVAQTGEAAPGAQSPVFRKEEDDEEGRRQAMSSIDTLVIAPITFDGDAPMLIRWAIEREEEFYSSDISEGRRRRIAERLLEVYAKLKEWESSAPRAPDGALIFRDLKGVETMWTEDRVTRVEDISTFTPESIITYRVTVAAPAAPSPKRRRATARQRPTKAPRQGRAPTPDVPQRQGFGVNVTFPKQSGMTLTTEEGQRRIIAFLIGNTRQGYTADQIDWVVSQLDLAKRWAPPADMDLSEWQQSFEAIPEGDKVTLNLTESFITEIDVALVNVPSRRAFQLAAYQQGVLDARGGVVLGVGTFLLGTAALGGGALLGTSLGVGGGGGGVLAGGGLIGGGGKGASFVGGLLTRQGLTYAGRYVYLNAPQLYGSAVAYGGAIMTGASLGQRFYDISQRGWRSSDAPGLLFDFAPLAGGYAESLSFRGPSLDPDPGPSAPPPSAPAGAVPDVPEAPVVATPPSVPTAALPDVPDVPVRPSVAPAPSVPPPATVEPQLQAPLPLLSSKPPANQNYSSDIQRARAQRTGQVGAQAADVQVEQAPLAATGTGDTGAVNAGATPPVAMTKGGGPGSTTPPQGVTIRNDPKYSVPVQVIPAGQGKEPQRVKPPDITARPKDIPRRDPANDQLPTVPEDRPSNLFNRPAREADQQAARVERGNTFNVERRGAYPYNEVRVEDADRPGVYYVLDSYTPGVAIVSRKYPEGAQVSPKKMVNDIAELVDKYPPGARISDTPQNRQSGLAGQTLRGRQILEVPVLLNDVPQYVRDFARRVGVVIRDIEGNVYGPDTPQ